MRKLLRLVAFFLLVLVFAIAIRTSSFESKQISVEEVEFAQVDAEKVAEELSGALQYQTVSFEDRTRPDEATLLALHGYLEATYPRVHSELERKIINRYSLLYQWPGSDQNTSFATRATRIPEAATTIGVLFSGTSHRYSGRSVTSKGRAQSRYAC